MTCMGVLHDILRSSNLTSEFSQLEIVRCE